ncbi:glycosyltransferase family protein [Schleiferia thermophila]|uniref:Uncharacterized protein (TIGR00661 family) n=1 Tax=Schleiferia thermophila TaxID=884107 RepID=A0A369A7K8_9FLAO|nr:glycosyltransferase family protein [Schleiferia thermophila]RCX05121.1 uncharacterized protein (TIGR00661 family) [Schleiferia thermophila]GCD79362.1 glycosyl transferase [Schleiferia thermophila]
MKRILYAIQGTGNGHMARALVLLPLLKKYFKVDVLISGRQSNLSPPFEIQFRCSGLSFVYDKSGGLSYSKTLLENNLGKIVREIKSLPVHQYDLIINDFEPISAYAAKLRGVPSLAFSHQASFLSKNTPRPSRKSLVGEFILKHYAPCSHSIGLHFRRYEKWILPPVIRPEILESNPVDSGEFVVYLPAYGDSVLWKILSKIDAPFRVFSKYAAFWYKKGNVTFEPANAKEFSRRLISCSGVITGAGFETPAEALYLRKKLLCIPIKGQYEQYCNAEALRQLNVKVLDKLSTKAVQNWLIEGSSADWPERSMAGRLTEKIPDLIYSIIDGQGIDQIIPLEANVAENTW